jgi:hypothetical protein
VPRLPGPKLDRAGAQDRASEVGSLGLTLSSDAPDVSVKGDPV